MPISLPEDDVPDSPLLTWVYRNIATVLLTLTIGLSSLVWQDLVVTMENMRSDIRELTQKINKVVSNQASYSEMIKNNRNDIRDIERRLRAQDERRRDRWEEHNTP